MIVQCEYGRLIIGKSGGNAFQFCQLSYKGILAKFQFFYFRHAEFFFFSCNFCGVSADTPAVHVHFFNGDDRGLRIFVQYAGEEFRGSFDEFCFLLGSSAFTCDFDVDVGHGKPPV